LPAALASMSAHCSSSAKTVCKHRTPAPETRAFLSFGSRIGSPGQLEAKRMFQTSTEWPCLQALASVPVFSRFQPCNSTLTYYIVEVQKATSFAVCLGVKNTQKYLFYNTILNLEFMLVLAVTFLMTFDNPHQLFRNALHFIVLLLKLLLLGDHRC